MMYCPPLLTTRPHLPTSLPIFLHQKSPGSEEAIWPVSEMLFSTEGYATYMVGEQAERQSEQILQNMRMPNSLPFPLLESGFDKIFGIGPRLR